MAKSKTEIKFKLPDSKKTRDWAISIMDDLAPTNYPLSWEDYQIDQANYDLYNNHLNYDEFVRFCNPLNLALDPKDMEILPYNKIPGYIDVLIGEELKRIDQFTPVVTNPEGIAKKNRELKEFYKMIITQEINKAIELANVKNLPPEEQQAVKLEIENSYTPWDQMINDFMAEEEILTQKIIKNAFYTQDLRNKKSQGWFHALVSDKEILYVGIENGKPKIEVINPLHAFFQKGTNVEFIEDGDWAGRQVFLSVNDILRSYGNQMEPEDLKTFEERYNTKSFTGNHRATKTMEYHLDEMSIDHRFNLSNDPFGTFNNTIGNYGKSLTNNVSGYTENVPIIHLEWKAMRKVGFLTYTDDDGEEITTIVSDDFIVPDDAEQSKYVNKFGFSNIRYDWMDEFNVVNTIEWLWIPEVWEGTRIDNDIYVNIRRKPFQAFSVADPFNSCKLGYKGRRYTATNSEPVSLLGRMKPYQYMYFVIMYQIGELVSRTTGPIVNIDTSQIDQALGDDANSDLNTKFMSAVEKTLYYMRKGIHLYNSVQNTQGSPNLSRPQPGNVSNLTASADLINMMNIAEYFEQQIGKAAGVSPQRAAEFSPNSNVTDNQQALVQSSHITERMFFLHSRVWSRVLTDYINIFREWAKNELNSGRSVLLQYMIPGQALQSMKIEDPNILTSEMAIFVDSVLGDEQYYDKIEQLLPMMVQKDTITVKEISSIIKARVEGTTPSELHKMILKTIENTERKQQAMAQNQEESQMKQLELQRQMAMEQHEMAKDLISHEAAEDRETEKLKAMLELNKFNLEVEDSNVDRAIEMSNKQADMAMKQEELLAKERIEEKKIAAKPAPSKA